MKYLKDFSIPRKGDDLDWNRLISQVDRELFKIAAILNAIAGIAHAQLHASAHHVGGGDLVNHDSLTGFVAAEHKSLPNTIAQVLSDHTKAAHDALGILHSSLGALQGGTAGEYYHLTAAEHTDFTGEEQIHLNRIPKIPSNQVYNGNFRDWLGNPDTLPDGWILRETPTILRETNTSPVIADYHLKITAVGGNYEGFQIAGGTTNYLKVRASTIYTLSFYCKVAAGNTAGYQVRSFNGAVGGTYHIDAADACAETAWTLYTFTFTTDANADNLQIQFFSTLDTHVSYWCGIMLVEGSYALPYADKMERWRPDVLRIKEGATPVAEADYGKVYTKNDNKIYFQDGAGVEHEIAFV